MLETQRATLTFIQQSDFKDVLEMFHEPDTFKYIAPLANKTDEEYLSILTTKIQENTDETGFYWIARQKSNNEFIGAMNLNPRRGTSQIQLGYQIRKKFWGQGFATELSQPILKFAKEERHLEYVIAVFVESHGASRRVLEKLDFHRVERQQVGTELLELYRLDF